MLTVFSIPKPFTGSVGSAQRNALASWRALDADVEVILVGDDDGVAEAAVAWSAEHVSSVNRSKVGTPLLDDAFRRVDEIASHSLRCFVNADVVFCSDFLPSLERLRAWQSTWLAIGRTCDTALPAAVTEGAHWEDTVRALAAERGVLRGAGAIDYVVFARELFLDLPPFVVGRAGFDNWMIWYARSLGVPVVDMTADVLAIHQSHDYRHLAAGKRDAYLGPEAQRNMQLAGGKRRRYSIADASHRLRRGQISRNPWAFMRAGDRWRRVLWKLGRERTP